MSEIQLNDQPRSITNRSLQAFMKVIKKADADIQKQVDNNIEDIKEIKETDSQQNDLIETNGENIETINNKINTSKNSLNGEEIKTNNNTVGYFDGLQVQGNTRYKKSDGTYTDTWEDGVTLESVGEKEKNSEGKCPIGIASVVGGTNLFYNTRDFKNWANLSLWTLEKDKYMGLDVRSFDRAWAGLYINTHIDNGETYTFSAYIKSSTVPSSTYIPQAFLFSAPNSKSYTSPDGQYLNISNEWKRYSWTFKATSTTDIAQFRIEQRDTKGRIYVCGLKLEKGNKATGWSPNPNDSESLDIKTCDKRTILLDKPLYKYDDTYKDYIDFDNNQIIRKCNYLILNGTESWISQNSKNGKNGYYLTIPKGVTGKMLKSTSMSIVNEYIIWEEAQGLYIKDTTLYCYHNGESLSDFKTWLQSNPITIVYPLATPIEEDIQIIPSNSPIISYKDSCTITTTNTIKGNIVTDNIVGIESNIKYLNQEIGKKANYSDAKLFFNPLFIGDLGQISANSWINNFTTVKRNINSCVYINSENKLCFKALKDGDYLLMGSVNANVGVNMNVYKNNSIVAQMYRTAGDSNMGFVYSIQLKANDILTFYTNATDAQSISNFYIVQTT